MAALRALVFAVGLTSVVFGVALLNVPAALVIGGLSVSAIAVALERSQGGRT